MPGKDGKGPRWGGGPRNGRKGRGGGCARARSEAPARGPSAGLLNQARDRNTACLDPEKCTGCGVCQAVCPANAIILGDTVSVDQALCTGCGTCIPECPNEALTLKRVRFAK